MAFDQELFYLELSIWQLSPVLGLCYRMKVNYCDCVAIMTMHKLPAEIQIHMHTRSRNDIIVEIRDKITTAAAYEAPIMV